MQNGEKHRAFEREAMLARTSEVLDASGTRSPPTIVRIRERARCVASRSPLQHRRRRRQRQWLLRRSVRPIAATSPIARSRANPRRGRASRSPVGALARLGGGFRRSGDRRGRPRSSCGNTCRGTVSPTHSWCAHNLQLRLQSQIETTPTWHYTFAKITPPAKQYQ
jgi:hypothetical protein